MGRSFADTHRGYFAANLRRLRVRAGLTQEELAEAASIATYYAQELEREGANPTLAVILALAEALDVTPARLFRKTTKPMRVPGRPTTKKKAKPAKRSRKAKPPKRRTS